MAGQSVAVRCGPIRCIVANGLGELLIAVSAPWSAWAATDVFSLASALWDSLRARLARIAPDCAAIVVTGHSLGGAVAPLIARRIQDDLHCPVTDCVTFGAPRFVPRGGSMDDVSLLRVCNAGDPVPHLPGPLSMAQTGYKWYVRRDGAILTRDALHLLHMQSAAAQSLWSWLVGDWDSQFLDNSIDEYIGRLSLAHAVAACGPSPYAGACGPSPDAGASDPPGGRVATPGGRGADGRAAEPGRGQECG